MMNSALVVEQSEAMAGRVRAEAGDDPAAQFQRAWRLAFSRPPSEAETRGGMAFLAEHTAALESETPPDKPANKADKKDNKDQPAPVPPAERALAHLCHALLISNEFLYVD